MKKRVPKAPFYFEQISSFSYIHIMKLSEMTGDDLVNLKNKVRGKNQRKILTTKQILKKTEEVQFQKLMKKTFEQNGNLS